MVLAVIGVSIGEWNTPPSVGDYVRLAAMLLLLASIVWYFVSIVFGLFGYLLFRSRSWIHGHHWVLLFAVIGFVTGAVIFFPLWIFGPTVDVNNPLAVIRTFIGCTVAALLAGTVTGLIFAWITKVKDPSANETASTFE
jgi:H+/Cl- antiporter ClcA